MMDRAERTVVQEAAPGATTPPPVLPPCSSATPGLAGRGRSCINSCPVIGKITIVRGHGVTTQREEVGKARLGSLSSAFRAA